MEIEVVENYSFINKIELKSKLISIDFLQMDFEALFFSRLHFLEKENRIQNSSLEFVWNSSDDLSKNYIMVSVQRIKNIISMISN